MDQNKLNELAALLLAQNDWTSSKILAQKLGLSVRTVKSYAAALNQGAEQPILQAGPKGYRVIRETALRYLNHIPLQQETVPQNYEERARYINQRFLTGHLSQLPLDELAEAMHYSVDTLKADVSRLNQPDAATVHLHADRNADHRQRRN